uniref:Uncharacterized protein n=1 Tax=Octactis speculum TaxID=3111310 RepID=A0A7S2MJW6_9STRA
MNWLCSDILSPKTGNGKFSLWKESSWYFWIRFMYNCIKTSRGYGMTSIIEVIGISRCFGLLISLKFVVNLASQFNIYECVELTAPNGQFHNFYESLNDEVG